MLIKHPPRRLAQGFSLVELMVGSVIGLIVIGAVTALVLSMMRSNRQTLQSTRLNQELRATLAVIASDLKRARGVDDPFTAATAIGVNPFDQIDFATPGCIRYGYSGGPGGDYRTVRLNTGLGRVEMSANATSSPLCTSTGTPLGSPQVSITNLTFTEVPPRRFEIVITGRLNDSDSELSGIRRTMRQTVFIRSIGDGT